MAARKKRSSPARSNDSTPPEENTVLSTRVDEETLEKLRALARPGRTWAAYINRALDSTNVGHRQYLLVGKGCTLEKPPPTYPADTAAGCGWKYVLEGFVTLSTGVIGCDPVVARINEAQTLWLTAQAKYLRERGWVPVMCDAPQGIGMPIQPVRRVLKWNPPSGDHDPFDQDAAVEWQLRSEVQIPNPTTAPHDPRRPAR